MKPSEFEYYRPSSMEEVVQLLKKYEGDVKLIAGGQSLVPMMNFRLAAPGVLVDINGLSELDYHRQNEEYMEIGALVRHATLAESPLVRNCCPLMTEAYRYVAHNTVRNRGTLCGNLCHADPASEMPAVMLAVDAIMLIRGQSGVREVSASDFFQGIYATAVEQDEMLVGVRIPLKYSRWGFGFEEVSARQGDFAMTAVACLLNIKNGQIKSASIVYAGVSDQPLRLNEVERRLIGNRPSKKLFEEVAVFASDNIELAEDIHADSAYRKDLIRALTPRALAGAACKSQDNW